MREEIVRIHCDFCDAKDVKNKALVEIRDSPDNNSFDTRDYYDLCDACLAMFLAAKLEGSGTPAGSGIPVKDYKFSIPLKELVRALVFKKE